MEATQPQTPDTPEWVLDTPGECCALTMFHIDTEPIQEIQLSRDEFVALKKHLANLRGYRREHELARFSKGDAPGFDKGPDQMTNYLHIARDFYRLFPALVLADEWPAEVPEP